MRRFGFYMVALCSGACVMMLEMIGFRMFAPHFGYSVYVTGSMISVILLSMSLGYVLGGWLADRSRSPQPMFLMLLGAGLAVLAVTWGYHPLLQALHRKGLMYGTLLGAFTLFTVPMLLLSVPSPFLIKLLANQGHVGTTAGQIVALSTIGSIVGTLLASFYLLPNHGVHSSLIVTTVWILGLALLGLAQHFRGAWLLVFALPGLFWLSPPTLPFPTPQYQILWDAESAYSRIIVVKDKYRKVVSVLPTYDFIQSEKSLGDRIKLTQSELDYYTLGGLLHEKPQRLLLLGLGAGSTFQQLRYIFPHTHITGVDIDPMMLQVGQKFFGLQQDKHARFVIADARRFIQTNRQRYDMIAINLTAGSIFIPFYMATREAFQQLKNRLSPRGWMLMNIVDISPHKKLARCIMHTAQQVWDFIYFIPLGGNVMMLASQTPWNPETLQKHVQSPRSPRIKLLQPMLQQSLRTIQRWNRDKPKGCRVWTDDRSALESVTFQTIQVR